VDPWIIALVAVSAVLHLAWNVRLKVAGDPLRTATAPRSGPPRASGDWRKASLRRD
jgi:hypothetical protein